MVFHRRHNPRSRWRRSRWHGEDIASCDRRANTGGVVSLYWLLVCLYLWRAGASEAKIHFQRYHLRLQYSYCWLRSYSELTATKRLNQGTYSDMV